MLTRHATWHPTSALVHGSNWALVVVKKKRKRKMAVAVGRDTNLGFIRVRQDRPAASYSIYVVGGGCIPSSLVDQMAGIARARKER